MSLIEPDCFWDNLLDQKDGIDFQTSYSGKLNYHKVDNFSNKEDVDLSSSSSILQSATNCNLMNSVCGSTNKLSYFKPIQTSAKFATLDTVLTHFMTLNKLSSILKPYKTTVPQLKLSNYMPNLLKSVPGVETFEHFLAPAHHRYQTVEIFQLAKQLLPTSAGECNDTDGQRNANENVLSTESTSKSETNIDFREADSAASTTPSPISAKSNNVIATAPQQVITPTTITPHIQKIGQPTSCSNVSFNRSLDNVNVPTSRNNSVAVVFVKNSDGQQHQSADSIGNSKRPESTVIRNNSEQQRVVQLTTQLSQNQQNSPQLAKILNKPISQPSSQPHLLQILNAPPSRNLNNNLFTATATNGNIVSGGNNSGNIVTFSGNNGGGSATLPNNLYICKTDGKTIQLTPLTNNRLMTTSMSNVKTALNGFYINNNLKKTVNQIADEVKIASTTASIVSMDTVVPQPVVKNSQAALIKSQINTRSVYEENYAKFIQTASQKSSNDGTLKTSSAIGSDSNQVSVTTATIQSNVLPKFNHVFGKTILSSDTIAATQTKTTTSTITLTVTDDDNNVSVSQDAATQTNAIVSKGKHSKKFMQHTLIKDTKMISDSSPFTNDSKKQQLSANHVIYSRQMPVLASTQQFSQSTIVQGINRMIQASSSGGTSNTTTTVNKNDIKIIHQPMSSLSTGMRISMPIVSSSMQQIQTKLIRPVIQLPPTILRSTGQGGEHRQQFLITTPSDPSSNVRYENLIVTASAPAQSTQSSSNNRNVDTSTLEQLREFDMVLEQVKERSTTTLIATPNASTNIAVNSSQTVSQLMTTGNNQIIHAGNPDIIYTTSNGQSVIQKLNLAYVQQHNLHSAPLVVVTNYCQPPLTSSSNTSQKVSTVASSSSSTATLTSPKNAIAQQATTQTTLKLTPKILAKSVADRTVGVHTSMLPKYTSTVTAVTNSISSTTPITTTNVVNNNNASISISSSSTPSKPPPKLQEDEQTVQRIYNILAEYAEQLRNSPDLNNKPAPRRRCNIPSNTTASSSNASTTSSTSTSTSKKRKSSQSSSSKRSTHDNELDRTLESEDSSGVSLHEQTNSDDASQHSLSNAIEKSPPVLITSVPSSCIGLSSGVLTPIAARSTTVSRQLIFADSVMTLGSSSSAAATSSSTSTVSHSRQVLVSDSSSALPAKVGNETVLMSRNYVLPMSVIKSGGQQYAIVASSAQASKLLDGGQIKHVSSELWQQQRSNQQSAIVLQGFLNKSVVRTGSVQSDATVKQPNTSQTFSNIEVGSTLCRSTIGNSGGGGTFILQTIPTTMSSETHTQSLSAFARVPQQSKQSRTTEALVEEQPSRGIIIIENVKEETKLIASTATTTSTTALVTNKRKFSEEDIGTTSSMTQSELKWSSDQYLDQPQGKSVYLVDSTDCKVSTVSTSPTQILNASKNSTADEQKVPTLLTPTTSSSDENLRYLISNPYQVCAKTTKNDQRNKHLKNNFILNTNGSSSGNRILLQQLCHERKQAAIERELRLQKSLSEECEDLGVGEPSTSDLFPEADLLFDTCSPAFDQDTSTPSDTSKQRIFFQALQVNRPNDGDDSKSDDDDKQCKLNKVISDNSSKGSYTPIFLRNKDDTMMNPDYGIISPYVQENSSSSSGGTNDKNYLEPIEIKIEETDNDNVVNDNSSERFDSDLTGDFDKLKNSMDWEGGPKKTYSKSSIRVVKRSQEYSLTPITKTSTSTCDTQPTLITISSPAVPPLHQRRITQYHNKKKIALNHRLGAIKSPKNDVIIIQRKRHLSSDKSTNEKATNSTIIPYIHNHSIGSNSGSISSSFKIINTQTASSDSVAIPSSTNPPKIINHQMRRCNNQSAFDEATGCATTVNNGSNVKASKQMKRR